MSSLFKNTVVETVATQCIGIMQLFVLKVNVNDMSVFVGRFAAAFISVGLVHTSR